MTRSLQMTTERWTFARPYRFSGHVWTELEFFLVRLTEDGVTGTGEAAGVYYADDRPADMAAQLEPLRKAIEAGLGRDELRHRLQPGGARNALDCALWDLEAKQQGKPVWALAGLDAPRPLVTVYTVGAEPPPVMAQQARDFSQAIALKLKLSGDAAVDAERVRAVREARPEAWIGVDGNQGFTRDAYRRVLPALVDARVELFEQPFPIGHDDELVGLERPIPVAADESVRDLQDLARVAQYDVINLKLDKSGGLTEALLMAEEARRRGLRLMVGNMLGTSRAMAPAFVVGQACDVVDLDGPLLLGSDVAPGVVYRDGRVDCPAQVWGAPHG